MARSKQYAQRVNILKMVRVGQEWKLAFVVERNGKIVGDHVLISGRDEHHPEGGYVPGVVPERKTKAPTEQSLGTKNSAAPISQKGELSCEKKTLIALELEHSGL
jgi:hypothetical protein